jgi:hypothetical protein
MHSQFIKTASIVPNDIAADNSNDLLDFPTYDGGVDSHDAPRRITDIISFTKKPCNPTLPESITWPNATADLVHTGTTSEVVTPWHTRHQVYSSCLQPQYLSPSL